MVRPRSSRTPTWPRTGPTSIISREHWPPTRPRTCPTSIISLVTSREHWTPRTPRNFLETVCLAGQSVVRRRPPTLPWSDLDHLGDSGLTPGSDLDHLGLRRGPRQTPIRRVHLINWSRNLGGQRSRITTRHADVRGLRPRSSRAHSGLRPRSSRSLRAPTSIISETPGPLTSIFFFFLFSTFGAVGCNVCMLNHSSYIGVSSCQVVTGRTRRGRGRTRRGRGRALP
jgi:hypothetical protein